MDRTEWLEARRRGGIGGSDIAAVIGVSPWRNAVDVWLDKTGNGTPQKESEVLYWGSVLEKIIAEEYARRYQVSLKVIDTILHHPNHQWMIGNIDRAIGDDVRVAPDGGTLEGAQGILEIKTASAFKEGEWRETVPIYYQTQAMWYLAITNQEWCDVAALIGGQKMVVHRIFRDEEMIEALIKAGYDFWHNHVLPRIPPEPKSGNDVLKLYPTSRHEVLQADDHLLSLYEKAVAAKENLDKAKLEYEQIAGLIKIALKDREALVANGKVLLTWKSGKPMKKVDWEQLAQELPQSLIDAYTKEVPSPRQFRILKRPTQY